MSRRSLLPALLLPALLMPAGAVHADPSMRPPPEPEQEERPTEWTSEWERPSMADLRFLRAATARMEHRTTEFRRDTYARLLREYTDRKTAVEARYDPLYDAAVDQLTEHRRIAIAELLDFIERYPDSPYTAHRMMRLADLYITEAEYRYDLAQLEYDDLEIAFDRGQITEIPEPPLKNYADAAAVYHDVVARYPDYDRVDTAYFMLGFLYADFTSEQMDYDQAEWAYGELLRVKPESEFAPQCNFRLGEIAFDGGWTDIDDAIAHYRAVIASYEQPPVDDPDDKLYDASLYKLAWSYYRQDDLGTALRIFTQALDFSEQRLAVTGQAPDMRNEAIETMAVAMADYGGVGADPMGTALAYFAGIGNPPYQFDVLIKMGEVLEKYDRWDDAVAVYEGVQLLYPDAHQGPDLQNRVIRLHQIKAVPDFAAARAARVVLVDRYSRGTPWETANLDNRKALYKAEGIVLENLREVSLELHAKAQQTGNPLDYAAAADRYRYYLDNFPWDEEAYELNFYLAEALFSSGRYEEAIEEYKALKAYPPDQQQAEVGGISVREASVRATVASYQSMVETRELDYKLMPGALNPTALPFSGEPYVYEELELSPLRQDFMKAIDVYVYEQPGAEQTPDMLYLAAETWYFHNRYDEARERIRELIGCFPQSDAAVNAAGLLVDSYKVDGDIVAYREVLDEVRGLELGSDPELAAERNALFDEMAKLAVLKHGELAFKDGDKERSAELFLQYLEENPDAPDADTALYNAARNLEDLGQTARSNGLYERLLREYPDSDNAAPTFIKMASNYERLLELDRAVDLYEQLVELHPDYQDAAAARFNAAFLRTGLGDFAGAARAYERYAADHPEAEDTAEILLEAGRQWENAGNRREAQRVYEQWLDRFGDSDPNRALEAQNRIGALYRMAGDKRRAEAALNKLDEMYLRYRSDPSVQLNNIGIHYAGQVAFERLERLWKELGSVELTTSEKKNKAVLDRVLGEEGNMAENPGLLSEVNAMADYVIATYPDFEWIAAASYIKGDAAKSVADMWFQAPLPKEIKGDFELEEIYLAELDKRAVPFQRAALGAFESLLAAARRERKNNEWVDRARSALNEVAPEQYPVFKRDMVDIVAAPYRSIPLPDAGPDEEEDGSENPDPPGLPAAVQADEALLALDPGPGQFPDFAKAVVLLEERTGDEPKDPAAWYNLGIARAGQGQFGAAIKAYKKAVRTDPDYAPAAAALALLNIRMGKLDDAEKVIGDGLRRQPESLELLNARVALLTERGKTEAAIDAAKQALKVNSSSVETYNLLGLLYMQTEELPLAEFVLRKAMQVEKAVPGLRPSPAVPVNLGLVYRRMDRELDAQFYLDKALTLDPLCPEALINRAALAVTNNDHAGARVDLERAVRMAPANPELRLNLAAALRGLGDVAGAERELREALRLRKDYAAAEYNLGVLLADNKKDHKEALQHYERFRRLSGELPDDHPVFKGIKEAEKQLEKERRRKADEAPAQ